MKTRKLLAVLLAAIVGGALCACNPGGEDYKREIPGYEEGKTNIVYYTWGTNEELGFLQDIIDDFKEENEDINVLIQKAGNDYYGDLEYTLAGNRSPDIVQMKPGYIAAYMRSGSIISLQEYIDASDKITSDMLWAANDGYRYNKENKKIGEGNIYSLIKDFSPDFVLNYNKNKITLTAGGEVNYPKEGDTQYPSQTTPMSFSQFIELGQKIQTSNMTATHLDNEPYQQILEWIQMAGGSMYSDDDKTVKDLANDPACFAAFDHYRKMLDEASDNTPIATRQSIQVGPGQLKQNQTASVFYGRWAYSSFGLDTNAIDFGYAPAPVPDSVASTLTATSKYAGITAMVGLSISAKSNYKDAAFKFIEYYFTEGQKKVAAQGFNIPGNKTIAETEFVAETVPAKERALNQFYLDLARDHSFVIRFNNYLSQGAVEDVMSKHLSGYFADSKGKAYDESKWKGVLTAMKNELQQKLTQAVNRVER